MQLSAARIQLTYNREMGLNCDNDRVNHLGLDLVSAWQVFFKKSNWYCVIQARVQNPNPDPEDNFTDELLERIESLSDEKSRLAQQLEGLIAAQSSITSSADHKICNDKLVVLEHKIRQLETSMKDMSESHLEQLEVIREGRNMAVEACDNSHRLKLEEMVNIFNGEKLKLSEQINLMEKILSDKEIFLEGKCKELENAKNQLEAMKQERNIEKLEKSELESQLRDFLDLEASLRQEITQV